MESDLLTAREKAAVLWAEHVTRNTARERDDIFEAVRLEFSEEEVVELTMISGLFNFFNRFMDSLHIPIEPQDEVNKIKKSGDWSPKSCTPICMPCSANGPRTSPNRRPIKGRSTPPQPPEWRRRWRAPRVPARHGGQGAGAAPAAAPRTPISTRPGPAGWRLRQTGRD